MENVLDIFWKAFDPTGFPPRWRCGTWTDELGWLHIVSDFLIFLAYFAIPLILIYFIRRHKDVPFKKVIALFAFFIISCGTGHLVEAIIFWNPIYRFAGLWKLMTAIISWATVIEMVPLVRDVLEIPGIIQAHRRLQRSLAHVTALRKAQNDIAYGTAHNLKESARAIHFRLGNLMESNSSSLPQHSIDELAEAREKASRLHSMLEEAVIHSNLMSCGLRIEEVNIVKLVDDIAKRFQQESKRVQLSNEIEPAHQVIKLDKRLMEWAMTNILATSVDSLSSDSDGLSVELSCSKKRGLGEICQYVLRLTFSSSLNVVDFQRQMEIFQGPSPKKSLSVADRILSRHEGSIEIREGNGSTRLIVEVLFTDGSLLKDDELTVEEIR